jgi:type I restriction enzyme S subunit
MDGRVSCDDLKWCEFSEREIESLALEPGDVLFIRTNGVRDRVGTCAVYRGKPERALFASYLIRARLKTDELDPSFFQYFTATAAGLAQLGGQASPAADGKFNVNTKTIDSVLVPLPDPDEQKEIAAIMQTIDRKISVHERKRAALSDLFQTMLNQLMTAQIRVDKLDIDTREVTALNPQ